MGKPTICIGENKGADQLRSDCKADQRLCFHYMDSTFLRLSKSKISSLYPSSVTAQPGLCWTWSEPKLLALSRTGSYTGTCIIWFWLPIDYNATTWQVCISRNFIFKTKFPFKKWVTSWENQQSAYAKTKTQISFAVTMKLISAFVFTTVIVQLLYFLHPIFQASSLFLWWYRPVYVRSVQKPHCWFFSWCRLNVPHVRINLGSPLLQIGHATIWAKMPCCNVVITCPNPWINFSVMDN